MHIGQIYYQITTFFLKFVKMKKKTNRNFNFSSNI